MSSLQFPMLFWWKHIGEITFIGEISTIFLCGTHWFLYTGALAELLIPIGPLFYLHAKGLFEEGCGEMKKFFRGIVLECVNRDFLRNLHYLEYLQYLFFTLTAFKIANTIAHQNTILKVNNQCRFWVRPRNITVFFVKKFKSIRDPVPLIGICHETFSQANIYKLLIFFDTFNFGNAMGAIKI